MSRSAGKHTHDSEEPHKSSLPKRDQADPAQFLYEAFAEAKNWDEGPSRRIGGRMKRWNDLSTYDRAAWRKLLQFVLTSGGSIPVPPPSPESVTIAASDTSGETYALVTIQKHLLTDEYAMRKVQEDISTTLTRLQEDLAKALKKNSPDDEPAETPEQNNGPVGA